MSETLTAPYIERNVVEPEGIVQVFRNFWWWCMDGDPKRAVFYKPPGRPAGVPQCNLSKALMESFEMPPGAQLIHIELAFVPWEY